MNKIKIMRILEADLRTRDTFREINIRKEQETLAEKLTYEKNCHFRHLGYVISVRL